jgi:hypothetical protein
MSPLLTCSFALLESEAMELALGIIFGGLITVLTAVGVEYLRRPKLRLTIENPPLDLPSPNGQGRRRNLRLVLHNDPLPLVARWMQRAAATQCRGEITFHHLDGQDYSGKSMAVRWVSSSEPIASRIVNAAGQFQYYIQDFSRTSGESRVDVYPGESELLDVAVRFDGEPDCYGWNNESYVHNWRNPDCKLPCGRYLVKVVIASSGQKCVGVFRLINDVEGLAGFRLMSKLPGDDAITKAKN